MQSVPSSMGIPRPVTGSLVDDRGWIYFGVMGPRMPAGKYKSTKFELMALTQRGEVAWTWVMICPRNNTMTIPLPIRRGHVRGRTRWRGPPWPTPRQHGVARRLRSGGVCRR